MNYEKALAIIVNELKTISRIEGIFLSGSLANNLRDDFSDIDLGIATKNSPEALDEIYAQRHQLLTSIGPPINYLERRWEHCQMIATLYGKSQFPPLGLEVDLIFSQLQYVTEQMPYAAYQILYDRNGSLQAALASMSQTRPSNEIEQDLGQHLQWFPFYVYDALKACKRGDNFQVQSLLEEMRKLLFFAVATYQGAQFYGSKRAYQYLTQSQRQILKDTYQKCDENVIAQIAHLFLESMVRLQPTYPIRDKVVRFQSALQELL